MISAAWRCSITDSMRRRPTQQDDRAVIQGALYFDTEPGRCLHKEFRIRAKWPVNSTACHAPTMSTNFQGADASQAAWIIFTKRLDHLRGPLYRSKPPERAESIGNGEPLVNAIQFWLHCTKVRIYAGVPAKARGRRLCRGKQGCFTTAERLKLDTRQDACDLRLLAGEFSCMSERWPRCASLQYLFFLLQRLFAKHRVPNVALAFHGSCMLLRYLVDVILTSVTSECCIAGCARGQQLPICR